MADENSSYFISSVQDDDECVYEIYEVGDNEELPPEVVFNENVARDEIFSDIVVKEEKIHDSDPYYPSNDKPLDCVPKTEIVEDKLVCEAVPSPVTLTIIPPALAPIYKCTYCADTFDNIEKRDSHETKQHLTGGRKKSYFCLKCDNSYWNRKELLKHNKKHDLDSCYGCALCKETFKDCQSRHKHEETHRRGPKEDLVFIEPEKKKFVSNANFKCEECGSIFVNQHYLIDHMKHHDPHPELYKCTLCPQEFYWRTSYNKHLKRFHNGYVKQEIVKPKKEMSPNEKPVALPPLKTKIYKCTKCESAYGNRFKLLLHMKIHNRATVSKCNICFRTYSCSSTLKKHHNKVHHGQPFKPTANKTTETETKKEKSVPSTVKNGQQCMPEQIYLPIEATATLANSTKMKCGKCDFKCSDRAEMRTHLESHSEELRFKCHFCPKKFFFAQSRTRHQIVQHKQLTSNKPVQKKKVKRDEYTQKKRRKPKFEVAPYRCRFCERSYYHFHNKNKHELEYHGVVSNTTYHCQECGIEFDNKLEWRSHYSAHKHSKYSCQFCNEEFSFEFKRNRHERDRHPEQWKKYGEASSSIKKPAPRLSKTVVKISQKIDAEKPYGCNYCDTRFTQQRSIYKHTKDFHPDKVKIEFPYVRRYKKHKQEVSEVPKRETRETKESRQPPQTAVKTVGHEFVCSICKGVFSQVQKLRLHMVIHHKFPCYYCDKIYDQNYIRNRHHKEVHKKPAVTDIPKVINHPFKCDYCEQTFNKSGNKSIHMNWVHLRGPNPVEAKKSKSAPPKSRVVEKPKVVVKTQKTVKKPKNTEKPYQCLICSKKFDTKIELALHSRNLHLDKKNKFMCCFCGNTYDTHLRRNRHEKQIHKL